MVHCSAGKDRTGLVVALVLSALGVDAGVIADDYALSAELLRGDPAAQIARRAAQSGMTEQIAAAALDSPRGAMVDALAHLQAAHGGAESFLLARGTTTADLGALRSALSPAGG